MNSKQRYYDTEFEYLFKFRPHEGEIPKRLEAQLQEGKKWPLDKLNALVSWMLEDRRKERLFYDAVIVCEYIAKKIGKCHAITDKGNEYSRNHRKLEMIRNEAVSFYDSIRDIDSLTARIALGARMRASYMLHDYDDLAEVKEDKEINQKHYSFIHNELGKMKNVSIHPPILRLKHKKRQEYYAPKNIPIFMAQDFSIAEIRQNIIAERKEREEMPLVERVIESIY